GNLPPKSSIREIRINQNPFSAEYDRLGFGRIEILTKPGTDRLRGSAMFNDSDSVFNSRNPYLVSSPQPTGLGLNPNTGVNPDLTPTFSSRQYEANLGGSLGKKASFFVDGQRRNIDDNAIINASRLDTSLNPYQYSTAVSTPNHRTEFSPRIDYQINSNNTLVMRYSFEQQKQTLAGIGNFTLASQGYNTLTTEHRAQLTETAVLGAKTVNETRFQFLNDTTTQSGDNTLPSINVLQAFNGGGSQVGRSYDLQKRFELQNYTSIAQGAHSLKFGVRIRSVIADDYSPQNFGGTFQFASGVGAPLDASNQIIANAAPVRITSIERYRRTLLFGQQCYLPGNQLGCGASQFSLAAGNPFTNLSQTDVGVFFLDDWRFRPNLTISLGLRYETQTNISDWRDVAPRLGFAWSPGAGKNGHSKTVIRGGTGIFYDRFQESNVLQSIRYNGVNQQNYIVNNPDFYPNIPSLTSLQQVAQTRRQIDSNLRAPYTIQSAIGVERQLPRNTTLAVTFTDSHTTHLLRSRNINAPLPGTTQFDPSTGQPITGTGVYPFGYKTGNIYNYESDGTLNQNQLIVNLNSRVNSNISIFTYYVLNHANSNTDGVNTFPADPYNLNQEYGRSSLDVRHRFVLGGSVATRYNIRLSPFVIANTGRPFNITTGTDNNGDLQYTDRPSFASASDCGTNSLNLKCTNFGDFNLSPAPGARIIPRNYGDGPGAFTVNLRLSKTWGFGESTRGRGNANTGGGGPGGGGPGGRGGGGRGGPGGFGGGGMGGMFGGGGTDKRFNLTLSVNARNLLNHVNEGDYSGNLTSPYFGRSNSLATGGFGPPGGATNNRRLDFQIRFAF
ncbi:MAG: TonB-dependent receptor, partial [Acidobacteriota bacterium]|nr:TonB-dependent receptor [Acidobacteriota bacterium]